MVEYEVIDMLVKAIFDSVAQWIEQSRPKGKIASSTLAGVAQVIPIRDH